MVIARLLLIVFAAVLVSGCGVITGIFKAGFWTAIVLVALVMLVIFWIVSKMRPRRRI